MQQYRYHLSKKFTEAYNRLNEQQRAAVDALEGPVMVIAGPGTGKTQILAARIGKILQETDARPDNILCLTYTDAGTIAMRRRLQQFIGPDAYKVNICTFHAFCNDVIQDNLSLFEKTALDPISDLERIQLYKKLIDGFGKNHPLKRYRGDVYFEINNLQQLFSVMKREGWTPVFINQKVDEYITSLPQRDEYIAKRATKTFKKGDVRTDKIAEETEKMEKLRAAVNEFDNFQNLMRQQNRYDFDDMINWVLKAFADDAALLTRYQEQYLYVLVDEYQDTSGTQNNLVQQLVSFWQTPNIFVVGDDDQSIYRFQGANVENMLDFVGQYVDSLLTVVLTNNYRSSQTILDVAQTLIQKNEERLVAQVPGLSKDLLAAGAMAAIDLQPQVVVYPTPFEEMAALTNQVGLLVKEGTAPGRIAIIYRENRYGEALAQYMRLAGLPIYSKRSINILQHPFIYKVLQILRYLVAELDTPYGGDEMLFEILHYDFYKIPPIEIARITVEVNSKKNSNERTSIRRMLADKAATPPQNLFDTGLHEGLKKASRTLEKLLAYVNNVTLQTLFAKLVNDETESDNFHLLSYIVQHEDRINLMQLLTTLFNFIKEETARNPNLNLAGFINTIDLMQKESLSIPMTQVSGTDKGINLLTAHGSKGLEYEYVFVAGCSAGNWEKKRKPGGGYKLPDTMLSTGSSGQELEELRRLFYVAITRAEQGLVLSYTQYNNAGKEQEPSIFIAEIQEKHQLPVQAITPTAEELFAYQQLQLTGRAPEIEKAEEDFISHALDKFVMNVTALNNYLKCPLEFYYKNLIRIPSGKSEALEFGSAIHHALEQLFKKMLDNGKEFAPVEILVEDFKWYMRRHRENFTKDAFNRRMEYGEQILADYYQTYVQQFNKIVTIERNIQSVVVDGVPLKGKLDKLEFDKTAVNVVDYKTGDIEKALPKMKGPDENNPNGGDYWRQAVFYKILVDNYEAKDWKVVSTEFDFVEPNTKTKEYRKEKIVISPADITTVSQQIKTVWQQIQERNFYTGCGKSDCHWCNFVKDNNLAVALHDMETGGEE